MKTNKRYSEEEKNWLKENYCKLGSEECSKALNRTRNSIKGTARSLGVKMTKKDSSRHHSSQLKRDFIPLVNPKQFKNIEKPEIAYLLGLIWADGWIVHKNSYSVDIKLKKEDFEKIEWIFDSVGIWKKYNVNNKNGSPSLHFRASGYELVEFLIQNDYHIKSGASACKILSKIPDHLKHYWWRGYFDGDGTIHCRPYLLGFVSVINQDWSFILSEYGFKLTTGFVKNGKFSKMTLTKKDDVYKFASFIYQNAENDNIYLPRKYDKFLQIKKIIENN